MSQEEDIDGLAAEYVLGTLDAAERHRIHVRRQTDAALSAAIVAWERRLAPLNEQGRGIAPPAHLLDNIVSRFTSGTAPASSVVALRRTSGRRWALVAGGSALAACLALAVVWSVTRQPAPQEHSRLDCGKLYKDFWQTRDSQTYARTPPEQLAGISRMALRAFDACQAGDEQDAKALLARLLGRSGERPSASELRRST
jgi:hypothetical protein